MADYSTDIERIQAERQAKAKMRLGRGDRKRLEESLGDLAPDERLVWFCTGQQRAGKNAQGEDTIGVMVLTDRRVTYNGKLAFKRESESFPLSNISSVSLSSGMALGGVTITGSGWKFDLQRVNKEDAKLMVEQIRAALNDQQGSSATPPPPPPPAAPAAPTLAEQIRELGTLREEGLLTEDEFQMQKARLLSGG